MTSCPSLPVSRAILLPERAVVWLGGEHASAPSGLQEGFRQGAAAAGGLAAAIGAEDMDASEGVRDRQRVLLR